MSVNYDDFVNDVEVGDMLLVDGMLRTLPFMSFFWLYVIPFTVKSD